MAIAFPDSGSLFAALAVDTLSVAVAALVPFADSH